MNPFAKHPILSAFDTALYAAHRLQNMAAEMTREAEGLELATLRQFGIEHVPRDPGFPCWTCRGSRYCNTPREALEAWLTKGK